MSETDRRRFVKILAAVALVPSVAGCGGDSGPSGGGGTEEPGEDREYVDDEPDYGGYLDDVSNYEGTVDERGQDEVTVKNGTGSVGQQFDPPAIAVDPGTTVVWEWTGDGGFHNVVAENGDFESELSGDEGHTFSRTFDEEGVHKYYCNPHKTNGMKGVVAVL